MIDFFELNQYPICDTDIWVKISLGNIYTELFKKYDKIIIADVVEGEILKWNRGNSKFKFIAEKFILYRDNGKILVIHHDEDINCEDRKALEQQLRDLGFENDFKNKPSEANKGEFVSAIYADYFEISLMKSNDGAFADGERGRIAFPDLQVKNWYDTTEELILDSKKKRNIRALVESQEIRMENEKKERIASKEKNDSSLLESKLEALQSKYNNN